MVLERRTIQNVVDEIKSTLYSISELEINRDKSIDQFISDYRESVTENYIGSTAYLNDKPHRIDNIHILAIDKKFFVFIDSHAI